MNVPGNDMSIGGSRFAQPGEPHRPGGENKGGASFQGLLTDLVNQVDTLQKDADASIRGLVSGETLNVHDVTVKMAEAGVAFDLMMQIRNKLIEAYQQILKMQP